MFNTSCATCFAKHCSSYNTNAMTSLQEYCNFKTTSLSLSVSLSLSLCLSVLHGASCEIPSPTIWNKRLSIFLLSLCSLYSPPMLLSSNISTKFLEGWWQLTKLRRCRWASRELHLEQSADQGLRRRICKTRTFKVQSEEANPPNSIKEAMIFASDRTRVRTPNFSSDVGGGGGLAEFQRSG